MLIGLIILFQSMIFLTNIGSLREDVLRQDFISVIGQLFMLDNFDLIKEIMIGVMLVLLMAQQNCFGTLQLIHQTISLLNQRSSFFQFQFDQTNIIFSLGRKLYILLVEISNHLMKISLVIWGLSSVSLIKLIFFLIAVKSEFTRDSKQQIYIFRFTVVLAIIYLFLQTLYNISFIDIFFKSFGDKLDRIVYYFGFYKYYNYQQGAAGTSGVDLNQIKY